MNEQQTFFCDLYGYENYNGQELTEEFLNNWEYLCFDDMIESPTGYNQLFEHIKELEENWILTTEIFLKLRVLRNDPIFKHLEKWGKIKLVLI